MARRPGDPRPTEGEAAPLRLADLDPKAVAVDVVQRALAHLQRFAEPLRIGAPIDVAMPRKPVASKLPALAERVERLTRFAQEGVWPLTDLDLPPRVVATAIQDVGTALYQRPHAAGANLDAVAIEGLAADTTPIGLVLLAAIGRLELAAGRPVTAKIVAALGGVDHRHVRRIAELDVADATRPARYTTGSVRWWLQGRLVPGFKGA